MRWHNWGWLFLPQFDVQVAELRHHSCEKFPERGQIYWRNPKTDTYTNMSSVPSSAQTHRIQPWIKYTWIWSFLILFCIPVIQLARMNRSELHVLWEVSLLLRSMYSPKINLNASSLRSSVAAVLNTLIVMIVKPMSDVYSILITCGSVS